MGGKRMHTKFYAVASGRTTGIVLSWEECKDRVHGYAGAKYKSFATREDAKRYLLDNEAAAKTTASHNNNNKNKNKNESPATTQTTLSSDKNVVAELPVKRKTPEGESSLLLQSQEEVERGLAPSVVAVPAKSIENPYQKKRVKVLVAEDQTATTPPLTVLDDPSTRITTTIPEQRPVPKRRRIRIHIMFDGGARGNPGVAGAGALVTLATITTPPPTMMKSTAGATTTTTTDTIETRQETRHVRYYVGHQATNNVAEYSGLVQGLTMAQTMVSEYQQQLQQQQQQNHTTTKPTTTSTFSDGELIVQGDSNLIIQQLHGNYKVKNAKLKPLYEQTQQLLQELHCMGLSEQMLEHVYRNANHVADALANEAMDARRSWYTSSIDDHKEQHNLP